jgi:Bacteriocin-protection, YdeI or OmpD-Associated
MLIKKLHLKPGMRFIAVNAPQGFHRALGPLPEGATEERALRGTFDLILLFVSSKNELKSQWTKARSSLKPDGLLWVAYRKKSSGVPSDLTAMSGDWDGYIDSEWQPVSLIALDEHWSATRFKHAPELKRQRAERQREMVHDSDGTLCIDRKNRVIAAPKDLQQLLNKSSTASSFFDSLSFTNRREYVGWVIEAKRPETRSQRLEQVIKKFLARKKTPSEK